jgi:hypothetical protein
MTTGFSALYPAVFPLLFLVSWHYSWTLSILILSLFLLTWPSHPGSSFPLSLSGGSWEGREEARTLRLKAKVSVAELPNLDYRFMECLRSNYTDVFDIFYKYCGQIYFSSSIFSIESLSVSLSQLISSFYSKGFEFLGLRTKSYLNSLWYWVLTVSHDHCTVNCTHYVIVTRRILYWFYLNCLVGITYWINYIISTVVKFLSFHICCISV